MLKPLKDNVLIEPIYASADKIGLIEIPPTIDPNANLQVAKGRVVSTGEGKMADDGVTLIHAPVTAGQEVLYNVRAAVVVKDGETEYRLVPAIGLIAVVE